MPLDLTPNVSNIVTGIVVALATYLLTRWHERKIYARNRRQTACDRFREAIAQEISLWHRLADSPSMFLGKLGNHFPELQNSSIIAALIEFRPFVKENPGEYDKTCEAYNKYKKKQLSEPWGSPELHPTALKLLETLLHFADD